MRLTVRPEKNPGLESKNGEGLYILYWESYASGSSEENKEDDMKSYTTLVNPIQPL